MSTIEQNKMIAEFMGGTRISTIHWQIPGLKTISVDKLNFNVSWNRLMPVVRKIDEEIEFPEDSNMMGDLTMALFESIEEAFKHVCIILEWYKENKKP